MKKRFILLAILLAIALLHPIVILSYVEAGDNDFLDNTEVNALLNELSDDWDTIGNYRGVLINNEHTFRYEVMNNDGKILVKTDANLPADLGRATTERYTMRDIKVDGVVVGKLLIDNDFTSAIGLTQDLYMLRYAFATFLEIVIISIFLFWVYRNIVRPFDKLKDFAADVASGNLDKPLEMDRGNLFGPFTESFDIMRSELSDAKQKEYEA